MFIVRVLLNAVLLALHMRKVMSIGEDEMSNGSWRFSYFYEFLMDQFILPIGHACVATIYDVYVRWSLVYVLTMFLKYVPAGVYAYKIIKSIYLTSRGRIKQKRQQFEDIQLQIQIMNTKLCVRDAEFTERAAELQRGYERMRRVRARVRNLISGDDTLRDILDDATFFNIDEDVILTPEQDCEFLELLKGLKYDQGDITIEKMQGKMDCGEHAMTEPVTSENSVYSSLSDVVDGKQQCHVKIVRVTNVYKVAYLRHYIKQKRLRRANKHAILKKKMESIKKLLEDWHKSLNMVINSKLTILNVDHVDIASQEAMGDYSKPTLRDSSDSDSDLRNSCTDMSYDEYSRIWAQNPYRGYPYYDDVPETTVSREYYEPHEYGDLKYPSHQQNDGPSPKVSDKLSTLLEETKSQIAVEEIRNETDGDSMCDLIKL